MILGDWVEVFQEFNELAGNNWKVELNRMLRGKSAENPSQKLQNSSELSLVFKRLIITVKYLIVDNKSKELEELKELLHNDILYTLLMQYEEEKVSTFDCYAGKLSLLYYMGKQDIANKLIQDIFKNVIVQIDSTIYEKYAFYGFESENELRNMANMLDSLVMTAARKRLGASDFKNLLSYKFTEETEMIEKITQQYIQYYPQLRERYSIEMNAKKEYSFTTSVNSAV